MYPNTEPQSPGTSGELEASIEREVSKLAPSRVTVLLAGGSKRIRLEIARALHDRAARAIHPFVMFDCGGLNVDTIERVLFGGPEYAASNSGVLQLAGAGTAYVTTIDELPLLLQPRFLRFLDQDRSVRVIASVEIPLMVRVTSGEFRLDLAERLNLVELVLPDAKDPV
jgi:Nif-specific regulatory protein